MIPMPHMLVSIFFGYYGYEILLALLSVVILQVRLLAPLLLNGQDLGHPLGNLILLYYAESGNFR